MYREPDGASSHARRFRTVQIALETSQERPKRPRRAGAHSGKATHADLSAIRLKQINDVLAHSYGDRADRDYTAQIIEMVAHLCCAMTGFPDNFHRWVRKRAPTLNPAKVKALIDIASTEPEAWDGAAAGRILRLSEIDRLRLRINTIEPCDLSPSERAETRKQHKREVAEARRRKAGAKDQKESADRRKPWAAMGISRRTYYRRKKAGKNSTDSFQTHDE